MKTSLRFTLFGNDDLHYFNEGTHARLYERLGAHPVTVDGVDGCYFAVWAPNAWKVTVIGSFNDWDHERNPLQAIGLSGIWEGFIPGVRNGDSYKYRIFSKNNDFRCDKADPYAFYAERKPRTASIVMHTDYAWNDGEWMERRKERKYYESPISIYELHFMSWRRVVEEKHRSLNYREMARYLSDYIRELGFTHVEFMPVMEHPYDPSWGYQLTGYFAPTSRFGLPADFMFLIDTLHQNGIGVLLDWVPSHFPTDGHGLSYFDGTHLYEHEDVRKGFHPDWKSLIFNYGRHEVKSFLISNAIYWLDRFHADGLRVDAVASMLYLNYSRKEDEWIPNEYGGNENLDAISFMRQLNDTVRGMFPDALMIAEESTAWPGVSHDVQSGGLGFHLKWDMGWMHDTLQYMKRDPIYRRYHQGELTFRSVYAFSENYVLSLSHDEVVHGKGSIYYRMPGDDWQKFANVRILYSFMYALPGKKVLFMGDEFAQINEWYYAASLDWHLLEKPEHSGVQKLVGELNRLYRNERSLYETDFIPDGFRWVDTMDEEKSIFSFLRSSRDGEEEMLCIFNFTPAVYDDYRVGVPVVGKWIEVFNSDSRIYGGSDLVNGEVESEAVFMHGCDDSISVRIAPLAAQFFKHETAAVPSGGQS